MERELTLDELADQAGVFLRAEVVAATAAAVVTSGVCTVGQLVMLFGVTQEQIDILVACGTLPAPSGDGLTASWPWASIRHKAEFLRTISDLFGG